MNTLTFPCSQVLQFPKVAGLSFSQNRRILYATSYPPDSKQFAPSSWFSELMNSMTSALILSVACPRGGCWSLVRNPPSPLLNSVTNRLAPLRLLLFLPIHHLMLTDFSAASHPHLSPLEPNSFQPHFPQSHHNPVSSTGTKQRKERDFSSKIPAAATSMNVVQPKKKTTEVKQSIKVPFLQNHCHLIMQWLPLLLQVNWKRLLFKKMHVPDPLESLPRTRSPDLVVDTLRYTVLSWRKVNSARLSHTEVDLQLIHHNQHIHNPYCFSPGCSLQSHQRLQVQIQTT